MNINSFLFFIWFIVCSNAHSASSSSALATSSIKFRNQKSDKDKNVFGRKPKIEFDDEVDEDSSKSFQRQKNFNTFF